MIEKTLNLHPFKLTFEVDNEFLEELGIGETEIDGMMTDLKDNLHKVAVLLHAAKAQNDASKEM